MLLWRAVTSYRFDLGRLLPHNSLSTRQESAADRGAAKAPTGRRTPKMSRKNRIVINLDQGRASGRAAIPDQRPRRWLRILTVLAGICLALVAIAAAAAFFWWRHYQTTPAYSLALVIDAAQRDDMTAFRERIDDEQITKNLVATVREKASGRYGLLLTDTLQARIDDLIPTLLSQWKDRVDSEVVKEIKEFSSRAESKPFVVVALAISSFATISIDGDNARAVPPIPDRTIEILMRRDGNRWKIVDFKDDVLVQKVVDGIMKDLPAVGASDLKIPLIRSPKPRRRRR